MRADVFVTVWGAPYVDKFLTYSLASQLAPGNVPALARDGIELVYHVYTDRASEPLFYPAFDALAAIADIRFHFYEDFPFKGATLADAMANSPPATVKHNVQRLTAIDCIAKAAAGNSDALLLFDSDFIFSENALPALIAARRDGAEAVCAMFLRLEEGAAAPRLKERIAAGMSAREIVALGLESLHPIARAMFVDAEPFTGYPSQLNWNVGRNGAHGFVTHCFFPHPMLTRPRAGLRYTGTMDYDYALRSEADDSRIHLVRRSDEFLVCKMTPASYQADAPRGGRFSLSDMARFTVSNTNIRHRQFVQQPVRFFAGGDEAEWAETEAASAKLIDALYKGADLIVGSARADARTMVFLKSFLGPIEDFASPQTASRLKGWM